MHKKILTILILSTLTLGLIGCGEKEDIEYYSIDKTDISEDLFYEGNLENVTLVDGDDHDFYISSAFTMKDFAQYDSTPDDYKVDIIDEINLNRENYNTDLSNYQFMNLETNETVTLNDINDDNGLPMLIINLSAFCSACDSFDIKNCDIIKNNSNYNYIICVENADTEEQLNYIKEKGGDTSKVYTCLGDASQGTNLISGFATPSFVFLSSDYHIRLIGEYLWPDGEAMVTTLSFLEDSYFPIIVEENTENIETTENQ